MRKGVASLNSRSKNNHGDATTQVVQNRRSFLARGTLISTVTSSAIFTATTIANARGLVMFPCKTPLLNKYHFLRAGVSFLESENIMSTNPLFLTNREAALSELGEEQVRGACTFLASSGTAPTIVRYSLAAASMDSANLVGEELKIGRDRLVPEFNYMDPRAIGGWDFGALNATEEALWALDADEAGIYGKNGKPPPNDDGTPNETLAEVVVRLTNLMSVLETLYSGDTLLLVFPDGTGPALLSCLIGGIPLNRVHEFQYGPGEIRIDINYNSMEALASQPPSQTYLDTIARGRVELKQLRENPDLLRNVKDLEYEKEKAQENQKNEAKRQEALSEKQREEEMRKEEVKAKELERQRKRKEIEQEKKKQEAKQNEVAKAKELESQRAREEIQRKKKEQEAKQKEQLMMMKSERARKGEDTATSDNQSSLDASSIGVFVTIAGGAVVLGSLLGADENGEIIDGGNNTDSSLSLIAPEVDNKAGVPSSNIGSDETVGTINVENNAMNEDSSVLLDGPTSSGENNVTDANAVVGADESVVTINGGENDCSESSSLSPPSLPRAVSPMAEDNRVLVDDLVEISRDDGVIDGTDANATATAADDNPTLIINSLGDPIDDDGADSDLSDSQTPQNLIDYDDWDDAWLGSISEIMNNSTEG